MIQARIPEAILRELPIGTETARLLEWVRTGEGDEPPETLRSWLLRNGFDSGEEVVLLPHVVTLSSHALNSERMEQSKRRLVQIGRMLIAVGLVSELAIQIAFFSVIRLTSTEIAPNDYREYIAATVLVWLTMVVFPGLWHLCALMSLVALILSAVTGLFFLAPGLGAMLLILMPHGVMATGFASGFALIARSRGRSPWLGVFGIAALFMPDRNDS